MTQQEFSELTGKDITATNFTDEYVQADRIYMAAGDIDKQTFCKDYRKSGATATLCALTERVEKQAYLLDDKISTMHNVAFAIIDTLLVIVENPGRGDPLRQAPLTPAIIFAVTLYGKIKLTPIRMCPIGDFFVIWHPVLADG